MTQSETTTPRKRAFHLGSIGIIALFTIAACLPIVLMLAAFLRYWLWIDRPRYSLLAFYLPQLGVIAFTIAFIIGIAFAIRKQKLDEWKTYLPLFMLVVYCLAMVVASRLIVEYSIRSKINDPENRKWSEAMISRALADFPTGVTCALDNQVVVLVREWSFVTPDGHMPVLTWSKGSAPNPTLLGNPVSCSPLQANWYLCYLSNPHQLLVGEDVCD